MIVGLIKEIKADEHRVALTPAGVESLCVHGHTVLVEKGAGIGSGHLDADYQQAGADLRQGATEVFGQADMIVHVKEPLAAEYPLLRPDQVLFTYLHLAADQNLTNELMRCGCVGIAYETVTDATGHLPLLTPMSEVAGRLSVQEATRFLTKQQGGSGTLLGGVTGVDPGTVLILGAGVVGTNAARLACGFGAKVYLLDKDLARLRHLHEVMPANCVLLQSTPQAIRELLPVADVVVGAVLVTGGKAPKLLTREMLGLMRAGSVLVDVAIDQGGCFETSRPTSHHDPVYTVDGIIHYCVTNMPAAVARTSTAALTAATLPYVLKLADMGWQKACQADAGLAAGVNVAKGKICCAGVAQAFGLPHTPVAQFFTD